jgi:hypothetical protein
MRRTRFWLAALFGGLVGPLAGQIHLPEVRIAGKTACQIHPDSGEATAALWIDAKQALENTTALDSSPPTLLVQEWRRTLAPSLVLRWERRDTSLIKTRQPFARKTPGNLERDGYIQSRRDLVHYYGPGADLLLSERFLRAHCFGRREGSGAWEGLVGLTFEPLPAQRKPDVRGVLWIDPVLHQLRLIEYTWSNAPEEAWAPEIGGRVEFARLADGGWIIQRWNMRMPRPSETPGRGYGGYTDQGGEVLAIGAPRKRRR